MKTLIDVYNNELVQVVSSALFQLYSFNGAVYHYRLHNVSIDNSIEIPGDVYDYLYKRFGSNRFSRNQMLSLITKNRDNKLSKI